MDRRFTVYIADAPYDIESLAGTSTTTSTFNATDWLEPLYASAVALGEIGELRLLADCQAVSGKFWEDIVDLVPIHTPVQLREGDNVVFDGVVVKHHVSVNGTETKVEIICYNNGDYLLTRLALHGQKRFNHSTEQAYFNAGDTGEAEGITGSSLITIDTPMIFNPQGLPNACPQAVFINDGIGVGNTIHVFDVPGRNQTNSGGTSIQAVPWKLSWAVAYLLNLYKTTWAIDGTSFADGPIGLFDIEGDPVISNINLEGKSLMQGLHDLLAPHNYVFWIDPQTTSGQLHRIHFAVRGNDVFTALVEAPVRGNLPSENPDANLISCDLTFDSSCIINTIRSYGDKINFTLMAMTNPDGPGIPTLVKGWNDADLVWATNPDGTVNPFDTTFRKNYCHPDLISPDIGGTPYGVGRIWVVNIGEQPNLDLEDLGTDLQLSGDSPKNSIDPRRLERPQLYTRNSAGGLLKQEDIQVELSFDGGTNWDICEKDWYRVLPDSMGIVFTNPKMERLGVHFKNNVPGGKTYWEALYSDDLRIRILCSIKSDERVNAIRSNIGSAVPLATERVFHNEGYRRFVFSDEIESSVYWVNYAPFEPTEDDTSELTSITNQQADLTDRELIVGQLVVLLRTWNEYHPGMVITGIYNRMGFDPAPTILRVIYDFQAQHVNLVLDSHIVKTVINRQAVWESDRREARLGIQGATQIQGGQQTPYLPGVKNSYRQYLRDTAGGE